MVNRRLHLFPLGWLLLVLFVMLVAEKHAYTNLLSPLPIYNSADDGLQTLELSRRGGKLPDDYHSGRDWFFDDATNPSMILIGCSPKAAGNVLECVRRADKI